MDVGSFNELEAFAVIARIGEFVKPIIYVCGASAVTLGLVSLGQECYSKYLHKFFLSNSEPSELEQIVK